MKRGWLGLCATALVSLSVNVAHAQWGGVKGQVVLDGAVPKSKDLIRKGDAAAKDAAVCAAEGVADESLVVDSESKGIANVIVYLKKKPKNVHPSLAKPAAAELVYDQKGCKFIPHVLVVRTDQQVKVLSDDAVAHNTRTSPPKNTPINIIIQPNDRKGTVLPKFGLAERVPVPVNCDIHPWMRGHWLIIDHPYGVVTDKDGKFELSMLPANEGELELVIWHENKGYLDKGMKLKIEDGKPLELKPLKVSAADVTPK